METTVYVYRNLHKGCYSIMSKGRVIGHATQVFLKDATFVIRPAGQKKVRETRKKNVHAFVKGKLTETDPARIQGWIGLAQTLGKPCAGVRYNPYRYDTFVKTADESPVTAAAAVVLGEDFRITAYEAT
jgi:hypothetical protein